MKRRATKAGVAKRSILPQRERHLLVTIDSMTAVVKAAREAVEFYQTRSDLVRPAKLAQLLWVLREDIKAYDETFANPHKHGGTHEQG